ncbi:MAG: hypothetical protein ACYSU4_02300 [Planctomycetota bacterium]
MKTAFSAAPVVLRQLLRLLIQPLSVSEWDLCGPARDLCQRWDALASARYWLFPVAGLLN